MPHEYLLDDIFDEMLEDVKYIKIYGSIILAKPINNYTNK